MTDHDRQRSKILNRWFKVFDSHFTHVGIPEERVAMSRALSDVHPEDLDAACLRAYQECQYYPKVADIRARVERKHEDEDQEVKEIWLRSSSNTCYAGSSVDGKKAVEKEYVEGRYTGRMLKHIMRCGCSVCNPVGRENWDRANASKRNVKPAPDPPPQVVIESMTPIAQIKPPLQFQKPDESPSPFWWDEEQEPVEET